MKKILFSAMSLCALLSSCANDEVATNQPTTAEATKALGISVGIDTKAIRTGSAFAKDEKIGVFIVGSTYQATKSVYTCPETVSGDWTTNPSIYLNNNTADVYAFHPETLEPNMTAFTVPVEVKAVQTITAAGATDQLDYLWAKGTGASNAATKDKVNLAFKHALSQVAFVIIKDADSYKNTGNITAIEISNTGAAKLMTGTGTMSLADGTIAGGLTAVNTLKFTPAAPITANATGVTTPTLKALVAPAAALVFADADKLMINVTVDTKVMTVALPITIDKWEAAKIYTYTLTIIGTKLVITSVTIADWTNGGAVDAEIN